MGSNPTLVTLPKSQSAGLEPARAEPSGFLVHPLNRLGTTAVGEKMDTEGFEPSTSRMRNGRSSTELSALREDVKRTPARIRTRVARFKVWSANHYTTGAAARLAQSVARGSHNPKVVSSILAPRSRFLFPQQRWGKGTRGIRTLDLTLTGRTL